MVNNMSKGEQVVIKNRNRSKNRKSVLEIRR